MKKTALLLLASCYSLFSTAQQHHCCTPPSNTDGMIAMAKSDAFIKAHDAPEPLDYSQQRGSMISFNTLDGKKASAYYVPSPEAATRVLLLFHEWWGLNDYIRREADRWQDSLGPVDVYAVDLYDGKVATTAAEASKLSSSLDERRTDAILKGLLAKAGKDKQIATLGWCMGGAYAFRASVLMGKQADGCVMYYGFPEKDVKKISPLKTDVLYIRGTQDQFITGVMVTAFAKEVKQAGRQIQVISYDAVHAFANPSNPHHDAFSAADAEQKALAFLRKYLTL
ncbi:MAG: dienelactone hydrolase family protein [Chitinophagaceae bacterium]